AASDPRPAQVVELHVFGGLTFDEIAAMLDLSERTARSDWTYARAVLADALGPDQPPNASSQKPGPVSADR
ncbi:MAG TPA: ECF-type sigma factor, partial [Candidatus Saccharimonadia bacterium]|nr:ECF-type sigma factor [Candidatus Saccharimonadia bacterium]